MRRVLVVAQMKVTVVESVNKKTSVTITTTL